MNNLSLFIASLYPGKKLYPYQRYLVNVTEEMEKVDRVVVLQDTQYMQYTRWREQLILMKCYWLIGKSTQMMCSDWCSLSKVKPIIIFDEFIYKEE